LISKLDAQKFGEFYSLFHLYFQKFSEKLVKPLTFSKFFQIPSYLLLRQAGVKIAGQFGLSVGFCEALSLT
jgi:hypothetical protein